MAHQRKKLHVWDYRVCWVYFGPKRPWRRKQPTLVSLLWVISIMMSLWAGSPWGPWGTLRWRLKEGRYLGNWFSFFVTMICCYTWFIVCGGTVLQIGIPVAVSFMNCRIRAEGPDSMWYSSRADRLTVLHCLFYHRTWPTVLLLTGQGSSLDFPWLMLPRCLDPPSRPLDLLHTWASKGFVSGPIAFRTFSGAWNSVSANPGCKYLTSLWSHAMPVGLWSNSNCLV